MMASNNLLIELLKYYNPFLSIPGVVTLLVVIYVFLVILGLTRKHGLVCQSLRFTHFCRVVHSRTTVFQMPTAPVRAFAA